MMKERRVLDLYILDGWLVMGVKTEGQEMRLAEVVL